MNTFTGVKIRSLCIIALFVIFGASTLRSQTITQPMPFAFPTQDTILGGIELPTLPFEPAGSHGAWRVSPEGHIVGEDNYRLKLFGVNLGQTVAFPTAQEAEAIAKRLRKFGFNAVRFRDVDYVNYDAASFFRYRDAQGQVNSSSYTVNPVQFAKFDTLFYHLKMNGIYTVFPTHIQHRYLATDGVMYADSIYHNVLAGFLDPKAAQLQREWAKTFLTHTNPLTGLRYADDPALAMVQYNNEASLYWYWNSLDRLVYIDRDNFGKGKFTISYHYSRRLDTLYNTYLKTKYGTDAAIRVAWCGDNPPPSTNLMVNASFENPLSAAWTLRLANGAEAYRLDSDGGIDSQVYQKLRIVGLGSNPAPNNISYTNLSTRLGSDTLYEISFWAKMAYDPSAPNRLTRNIQLIIASTGTNLNQMFQIDTAWKKYTTSFRCIYNSVQNVQLRIGAEMGDVWLDAFNVKALPEIPPSSDEKLSTYSYRRMRNTGTLRMQPLKRTADLVMFYDTLQKEYFAMMDRLLRDTLNIKALINHRQNGYWTQLPDIYTAANTEAVCMHHNHDYVSNRPGMPNTDSTWMVRNNPMVKSKSGGSLVLPSAASIKGQPAILDDYYTPWANQHRGEQFVLMPAWGSYQDWDGMFIGYYGVTRGEVFTDSLPNFYRGGGWSQSIVCDPTIMSLAPFASTLFRGGHVKPAGYNATLTHVPSDVWQYVTFSPARNVYGVDGNIEGNIFTQMQVRQHFNDTKHKVAAEYPYLADTASKLSDTQELLWDGTNGRFTVTTPKMYAGTGLYASDTAKFPYFAIRRMDVAATGKENFTFYLMSSDDKSFDSSQSQILALSTRAQTTGMVWADSLSPKTFGTRPTVISPPTAVCVFTSSLDSVIITPLDSVGSMRQQKIIAQRVGVSNKFSATLDVVSTGSLWYKVEHKAALSSSVRERVMNSDGLAIEVSPNPSYDRFTVWYSPESSPHSLEICDMMGRTVRSVSGRELTAANGAFIVDASTLPAGSYIVILCSTLNLAVSRVSIVR